MDTSTASSPARQNLIPADVPDMPPEGAKRTDVVGHYVQALRTARDTALLLVKTEDGGTCNFDTPYVRSVRDEDAFREAAGIVQITLSDGYGIAKGGLMVLGMTHGQGNRRTRMAEQAARVLKAFGLDARMFYAMD